MLVRDGSGLKGRGFGLEACAAVRVTRSPMFGEMLAATALLLGARGNKALGRGRGEKRSSKERNGKGPVTN